LITRVDEQFRLEVERFGLRCTCQSCSAFEPDDETCAYGYDTEPHRRLELVHAEHFTFCKAFELR
jgi:hypothetical protein